VPCVRTVHVPGEFGLVEASDGIAIMSSFYLPACRNRKVTMSELVEPVVTPEFYEVSDTVTKLAPEAGESAHS
jgi:hypothetical protein